VPGAFALASTAFFSRRPRILVDGDLLGLLVVESEIQAGGARNLRVVLGDDVVPETCEIVQIGVERLVLLE